MSELGGIIRNGIERGWPTDEIKNSLINAGYTIQEVDYELSLLLKNSPNQPQISIKSTEVAPTPVIPSMSPVTPAPVVQEQKFNPQDLSNYQTPAVEKKASNGMVIAIISLLILCVLAGAGLFLFG